MGIKAEDMHRLFTRFGKLQRTAKINSEGLGLGLTISKQIVEAAGGEIWATSKGANRGSTFAFTMQLEVDGPVLELRIPQQKDFPLQPSLISVKKQLSFSLGSQWIDNTDNSFMVGHEVKPD